MRVLLLGSGGLTIGQAGEFDYSGSQAIKALKEEGVGVVLVNPNIATIQTSEGLADRVYFLPLTPHFVGEVIAREKPDGILLGFGGQTALNCGVELHRQGLLERHGCRVLGTPVETVVATEDRELFARRLAELGVPMPKSEAVRTRAEAREAAERIGYPVLVRAAYTLGGLGSGVAKDARALDELAAAALAVSGQLLIERALAGWKEIEYEVLRDRADNCITVCNMENLDPLGIHTGESIVVAPSQTLSNDEYHELRRTAVRTIRSLGVVGECNIQFAVDPRSGEYVAIEVNARLSRSSALASKATGYPLAFVAAKLAIGKLLSEVKNPVTGATSACFEPALDYVVVKVPRWDLGKFRHAERRLGTAMKSVGEVMGIGRSFEEALQKAVRMVSPGLEGLTGFDAGDSDLEVELREPTDRRLLMLAAALEAGWSVERVGELTGIDPWFLHRIQNIVRIERLLDEYALDGLPAGLLREAKRAGFSDAGIGRTVRPPRPAEEVRARRKAESITPVVKQIDTTAGEFPARTNYLYLTYHGDRSDALDRRAKDAASTVIVLGSGAYRIGSSVEFDWCCVGCIQSLARLGHRTAIVNHNPETVSTDYDVADRLYFEELSVERLLDICELESPLGVVVSMGGQTPNNLALPLARAGVPILGTPPEAIDRAEDRHKFSALLDRLGVDQPRWREAASPDEALAFAREVGYPVLVRPSYVLSGAAMNAAYRDEDLTAFLARAAKVSPEHPVVVSEFVGGAKEIEVDAVARGGEVVAYSLAEHVEFAGVHSGDSVIAIPAQQVFVETVRRIKRITRQIAAGLRITGPFNLQFLARENRIRVIECNLRASRSFPFASKVLRLDFADLATRAMMGAPVEDLSRSMFELDYVGVKAPQFSFARIAGADPVLGMEMASTGEVACFGDDLLEAFLKSLLSVGYRIPEKGVLLSTGTLEEKTKLLPAVRRFAELGLKLYATGGTATFLAAAGIHAEPVAWPLDAAPSTALDLIASGAVDLVLNIPKSIEPDELTNDYLIRRQAVDRGVGLLVNAETAALFAQALARYPLAALKVRAWDEYK